MRERTIARNYASALMDLGLEHGEEERYARAFAELSETLAGDDRIQRFMATPKVEASVKESVVPELAELYRKHIGSSGGYGAQLFGE